MLSIAGSGPNGICDIKSHPFFQSIDWEALYNRQVTPPFIPAVNRSDNTVYFDKVYEWIRFLLIRHGSGR